MKIYSKDAQESVDSLAKVFPWYLATGNFKIVDGEIAVELHSVPKGIPAYIHALKFFEAQLSSTKWKLLDSPVVCSVTWANQEGVKFRLRHEEENGWEAILNDKPLPLNLSLDQVLDLLLAGD